jgi:ketosteroid isomerase-like protein
MWKRVIGSFTAFVLCAAAAAPAAPSDDAREAIAAARGRFAAAAAAGDAAQISSVLAPDAVLLPPGQEPVSGPARIAEWLRHKSRSAALRPVFSPENLRVEGDLAYEYGHIESAGPAGAGARRTYLAVWKKQPDGRWTVLRGMWSRLETGDAAPAEPAASAAPAAAPMPAVVVGEGRLIPIPDPRPISDGYARAIGDRLHAFRKGIEEHPDDRDEVARAAKYLESQIRDIGWIDVPRFGLRAACDAAFLAARSGDRRLLESTIDRMRQDLGTNQEGGACYQTAADAYRKAEAAK